MQCHSLFYHAADYACFLVSYQTQVSYEKFVSENQYEPEKLSRHLVAFQKKNLVAFQQKVSLNFSKWIEFFFEYIIMKITSNVIYFLTEWISHQIWINVQITQRIFINTTVCRLNRTGCNKLHLDYVLSDLRDRCVTLFCFDMGMLAAFTIYVNRQHHGILLCLFSMFRTSIVPCDCVYAHIKFNHTDRLHT